MGWSKMVVICTISPHFLWPEVMIIQLSMPSLMIDPSAVSAYGIFFQSVIRPSETMVISVHRPTHEHVLDS